MVSLQIGSTQATVNGQPQNLDVAPFIVGATTYVPLRFVAQSLGAHVGYDASTRVVAIDLPRQPPSNPVPPPRPPAPPPSNPVQLISQRPAPGASVSNRFVVISAEFTRRVDGASVRVWLDGNNITNRSGVSATSFSYKPPAPLDFGSHTVRVGGRGPAGTPFDRSWSFTVSRSGSPIHLTINQPNANAPVGPTFTIAGNTVANGRVQVTVGASPSATGQFKGSTTAGPLGNFQLKVSLRTLIGQQAITVKIMATDPTTSRSTETVLRLRLNQ
jgi:hypothetical protein